MAMIICPECKRMVSDKAITCPNCGCPIAEGTNTLIRIKVDTQPNVPGSYIEIRDYDGTGKILAKGRSGSVLEFHSDKPIRIAFYSVFGKVPMCPTVVSPEGDGKYRAKWGMGLVSSRITSCSKVDFI